MTGRQRHAELDRLTTGLLLGVQALARCLDAVLQTAFPAEHLAARTNRRTP